ncbi:hypothetical protein BGX26_000703 [Mortierella sp. AD094]|nr:hypothetical protein BGX26_000703 [Mortierella sp. AD094]
MSTRRVDQYNYCSTQQYLYMFLACACYLQETGAGDEPGPTQLQQMQVHVPKFERYHQVYGDSLAQSPVDPYETLVMGDTPPPKPQDSESGSELEREGTDLSSADGEDITATVACRTCK